MKQSEQKNRYGARKIAKERSKNIDLIIICLLTQFTFFVIFSGMVILQDLEDFSGVSPIDKGIRYYLNNNLPECNNPIMLGDGRLVPCGHCELCSGRLKKEWILRCRLEMATSHYKGMFLTLTFDDEHYKKDTSYKVVQDYLKRLRVFAVRRAGYINKFKYFGVYENGDKTGRGHYHLLVFGWNIKDVIMKMPRCGLTPNEFMQSIWQQGFAYVEDLTPENIFYTCGYVQKKRFKENEVPYNLPEKITKKDYRYVNKYATNIQEANFMLNFPDDKSILKRRIFYFMSKGLGFAWLLQNVKKVIQKNFITTDGYKYPVPRAFRRKIEELFGVDMLRNDEDNVVNNEFYDYCINLGINFERLDKVDEFMYILGNYVDYHFDLVKEKDRLLKSRRLLYEAKKK